MGEWLQPQDMDPGDRDVLLDPGARDLLRDGELRDLSRDPGVRDLFRDLGVRDALRLGSFRGGASEPESTDLSSIVARSGGWTVPRRRLGGVRSALPESLPSDVYR